MGIGQHLLNPTGPTCQVLAAVGFYRPDACVAPPASTHPHLAACCCCVVWLSIHLPLPAAIPRGSQSTVAPAAAPACSSLLVYLMTYHTLLWVVCRARGEERTPITSLHGVTFLFLTDLSLPHVILRHRVTLLYLTRQTYRFATASPLSSSRCCSTFLSLVHERV